ncbi:MAG: hypothetical protein CSB47_09515 [Proteobacteria bacterium]|nr:MAG: hypothetical protein CSB47_09515 [Pseudomonadota bacterium]
MGIIHSAIPKLNVGIVALTTTLVLLTDAVAGSSTIFEKLKRAEPGRPVSSLQVVNFVKTKYANKGKGIGLHKYPQKDFPDCYVVKLMDNEGVITILKINCKK